MGTINELTQDNFAEEVIDRDGLAVVDFHAEWCTPCKPVAQIMERLAGEYDGKVRFYRLDIDRNPELAERLRITDIPTVLFVGDGGRMDIQRGTASEGAIRGKLEALL